MNIASLALLALASCAPIALAAQPAPPVPPSPTVAAPPASLPQAPVHNPPYGTFKMELPMIQRNVLAGVRGRLGGMAIDARNNILYVAATAAGSIEVHQVAGSKQVQSVGDLPGPQGLVFIPELRLLVASCATDGSCRVFKAGDDGRLTFERSVPFGGEAGPLAYDTATGHCWVGHGVFVSCFDPRDGSKKSEVALQGIGRPIAIVAESLGPRLFALTASANEVVVIDRSTSTVTARWPLSEGGPSAIALDEVTKRVFIACRTSAKLLVLDAADGREVARLDGPAEPGSLWFDARLRKVYIAGNQGHIGVIAQTSADEYRPVATEASAPGSRMSLLVPEHRRLIVSCPQIDADDDQARLFVYQIGP